MNRGAEARPLQIIRDALPQLTGAKLRVAEAILNDPDEVERGSITWLAKQADTSPTTITRLSIAWGYTGFPDLRAAIANENGRDVQAGWESDIGSEVTPESAPADVLRILGSLQFKAVRSAIELVDLQAIDSAATAIAKAKRVHIFAEWGDTPPATELYFRLFRIGVPVWIHAGAYEAEVGAGLLGKEDVALVLSRSGESEIARTFLERAKENRAIAQLVTGTPESTLGQLADISMFTGTGLGGSWTEYFAGRSSDGLICGLLWMLVAQKVPDSFEVPAPSAVAKPIRAEAGKKNQRRRQ
ncbi:MurR/RpiR family transcriptional regulator [Leifsonia flava]|uniref:MurR/RpiR family transcriptional regulator n=1 Tax=Orlajensenia leifsoniae TaxID=2561933 RepID=A0A4Y9R9H2_9MICO|nr:MurR/RpiR family transcriptional regulator [Leifsonia flava]TFV99915.1 MurR/RpiR family transcriptional regulator [Leifsonia flava]